MEELLFDECEEEDPNPNDESFINATSCSPPAKRRRKSTGKAASGSKAPKSETSCKKLLNKSERKAVMDTISKLPLQLLAADVKKFLLSQIGSNTSSVDILYNGKSDEVLYQLLEFHRATFIAVYNGNDKGKEKYLRFQLDWHKNCSIFLLEKELPLNCILDEPSEEIKKVRQLWTSFCEEYTLGKDSRNRLIILLSSAMYNLLLQQTQNSIEQHRSTKGAINNAPSLSDGDDVYFRFGGATLASMLHNRYKDIKKCTQERHIVITQEIKLLHIINTKDKSSLPEYLEYRDRGFMYSPDVTFISFFRDVDQCVRQVVNEKGLQDYGDQLIKVAHELLSKATHLKEKLFQLMNEKVPLCISNELETQAAHNIYEEMLRKLCNTRLQEFLSSLKQTIASKKGLASTAGQNLRDKLLTQHTNLQSRIHFN